MLCQIRHGSCHAQAILFKVLADTVGLDSRLVVVSLYSATWSKLLLCFVFALLPYDRDIWRMRF